MKNIMMHVLVSTFLTILPSIGFADRAIAPDSVVQKTDSSSGHEILEIQVADGGGRCFWVDDLYVPWYSA